MDNCISWIIVFICVVNIIVLNYFRTRDMVDLLEGDLVVDHEEAPEVIVVDAVGEDPHSKCFFVQWNTFATNLH